MFTGIIESVGHVKSMQPVGGDIRLTIESDDLDFSDVKLQFLINHCLFCKYVLYII